MIGLFRSTPPRGERPVVQGGCVVMTVFRSTPPRGERHVADGFAISIEEFRSTPPRGERRPSGVGREGCKAVSIHAPAGGATFAGLTPFARARCFDPRPRGGSDGADLVQGVVADTFRSTPPRGERRRTVEDMWRELDVSIHAPAGGATTCARAPSLKTAVSIHAPAGGATDIVRLTNDELMFRSTPPRGERPRRRKPMRPRRLFRSTPPRGERRLRRSARSISGPVSIHAPAGGATQAVRAA